VISVTKPKDWMSTKTGSLSLGDCKSCIKSMDGANVLTWYKQGHNTFLCQEIPMSLALFSEPQLTLQEKICQM